MGRSGVTVYGDEIRPLRETKEQYIARLMALHPGAVFEGDSVTLYPGDPVRRVVPCTGDCDYEECTGWVCLRLEEVTDVR